MARPRLVATQTAAERTDARQKATIAALTQQLEAAHAHLARVERTLAALLRSETTTEAQRAELAGLLAGTRAIRGEVQPAACITGTTVARRSSHPPELEPRGQQPKSLGVMTRCLARVF